MKRLRLRILGPLVGLLFGLSAAGAAAQAGAAIVRPDPAALSVAAGQTQTVAVVAVGVADLYGIDVRASFDPALIEIVDADPAHDGVQMTPGVLPQPDFVAINVVDNAAGTLRYATTQINPTPPAAGDGVVFRLQVRGKAAGVSPLRIDLVEMANRSGELLGVTTQDAAITVTGAGPAAATGIILTPLPGDATGAAATATGPAAIGTPTTPAATDAAVLPGATASTSTAPVATSPATTSASTPASNAATAPAGVTSAATAPVAEAAAPTNSAADDGAPAPDSFANDAGQSPGVQSGTPATTTVAASTAQGTPALAVVGAAGDAAAASVTAPAAPAAGRSGLLLIVAALAILAIGAWLWLRARSR